MLTIISISSLYYYRTQHRDEIFAGFSSSSDGDSSSSLEVPSPLTRNVRRRTNSNVGGRAPTNDNNNGQARRRVQMGGFVNTEGTALRTPGHATALIGILQLAEGHPEGIAGALGHNNRSNWIRENITAFFANDGPCQAYDSVIPGTLIRHLSGAQRLAKSIYTRHHSNDQTGAGQEDVPEWARLFFWLFQVVENQETRNSQAAAACLERRTVSRSITGAQAPLGHRGNGPAQLRTETSRNDGEPMMRQQVIGNVNS